MVTSTLVDTVRRARASWRGQLAVLGAGALLLGLTLLGGGDAADLQLRVLVGALELLLLVAASVRMALVAEAGFDSGFGDVAVEVARSSPRLLAQVAIVGAIPAATWWLAFALMSMAPLLGLVLVPVAFAVLVLTLGPMLLAACSVVQGDDDWLPRSAWRAVRGRVLVVAGIVLVGGVAAAMVTLPLALVGIVVNATAGMLGFAGVGLVAAAIIPWLGCGALATWRQLGATVQARPAGTLEPANGELDVAAAFGTAPAPVTTWLDGPAWDVAVEPGAAWGTWIRIEAPSVLGFRVSWHGGAAPVLAFASEAGAWTQAAPLVGSGDVVQAALPAGSTYLQVTSCATASQALSVHLLVPPAVAA